MHKSQKQRCRNLKNLSRSLAAMLDANDLAGKRIIKE